MLCDGNFIRSPRNHPRGVPAMRPVLLAALAALALLPAAGQPPAKPPRELRVAAVQMRSRPDIEANVKHTIDLLTQCRDRKVDVAVFPECSVSGYFDDYVTKLSTEQLASAEKELCQACKD